MMPKGKREPAIQTICSEAGSLFDDIAAEMDDPEVLEKWMDARGVHCELFIYTGDSPWQEILDAGAELHASAVASDRCLFRTEGDSDTVVFFVAKTADKVLKLLRKFKSEDMVIHQVMTA